MRIRSEHALRVGQRDFTHEIQRLLPPFRFGQGGMEAQDLVDLPAAAHHRIERGHRLLEDHRHARAAQLAQSPAGAQQLFPFEKNLSGRDAQRARQ